MTTATEPATIPEGDDLARQTAQAKMLREARDTLAARARKLADKKDRRGLERLGIPKKASERTNTPHPTKPGMASHVVDEILAGDEFNSADLAEILGVKLLTLRGWMAPAETSVLREMPQTAKLLLARILDD